MSDGDSHGRRKDRLVIKKILRRMKEIKIKYYLNSLKVLINVGLRN